ncbi:hypothetical protein BD770DRAFT_381035 [Pilaira anomala]|nr:hypothetical protein BD770DRAFT_381035 [Pilaira anomala]
MIPLVWAILIYQLLAFLGANAVAQLVTFIAYMKQDIDTKLMYSQSPLEIIVNYNKFKHSNLQKIIIIFLAAFAILLSFIPTVFTKLISSVYMYTNYAQAPLKFAEVPWSKADELPVMNNVLSYLRNPNQSTVVEDILTGYLKNNLLMNITENPTGIWFGVSPKPVIRYSDEQYGNIYGFWTGDSNLMTFLAFGLRSSDDNIPSSSTLDTCTENEPERHPNFTDVSGFKIEGSLGYYFPCYPMFDRSTAIYKMNDWTDITSVLSVADTIYRPPILVHGVSAHGSFGVSLFNHNETHMSMGIKKMASITIYNYKAKMPLPSDCNPPGKTENATIDFKDLPSSRILCTLLDLTPSLYPHGNKGLFQATRRYYDEKNHALNAVYTIQQGTMHEEGQSVMVDLNMFAVYTIEGHLPDEREYLLAFETMQFGPNNKQNDSTFEATLANNNLENIINRLDSTVLDNETINTLATLASIRTRWANNDFSDFTRHTANVSSAVETSTPWLISVVVLLVVFLIFQFLRLIVRRNQYYTLDFRSIVISTVDNKSNEYSELDIEAKRIGLDFSQLGQSNLGATLTIDGYPIEARHDGVHRLKPERSAFSNKIKK